MNNFDLTQINGIWSLLGLATVLGFMGFKWYIEFKTRKVDRDVMTSLTDHVQKQSNILDVILKQYSANITMEQMVKVYDWVFYQAHIKIFMMAHNMVYSPEGGFKISNFDTKQKLIMEITNLYTSDMQDLSKFKYKNIGLDEFVAANTVEEVITLVDDSITSGKDRRVIKELLETKFTAIKLRTVQLAKDLNIINPKN